MPFWRKTIRTNPKSIRQSWTFLQSLHLIAFEGDPDVFTVDTLAAIESLNERYMEVDSAIAVGSLLNYPLNDADSAEQGRRYLIPELRSLTDDALAVVRRIALADEDLTKRILSRDGSMTLATVKYKLEDDTQAANLALAGPPFGYVTHCGKLPQGSGLCHR